MRSLSPRPTPTTRAISAALAALHPRRSNSLETVAKEVVTAGFPTADARTTTAGTSTHKPRLSLRAAIDSMCKSCLYDPNEPGRWREQIDRCTAPRCPLYSVRPRSSRSAT